MTPTRIIYVLLISVGLAAVERRWRVPYLQGIGRLIAGSCVIQFALQFASPKNYLFAALGLAWIIVGWRDIELQRTARQTTRTEEES